MLRIYAFIITGCLTARSSVADTCQVLGA